MWGSVMVVLSLVIGYYLLFMESKLADRPRISTLSQIYELFPDSKEGIDTMVKTTIKTVTNTIESLYPIADNERTFDNTLGAFDTAFEHYNIAIRGLYLISVTTTDEVVRKAAQDGINQLQSFGIDMLILNQEMYDALRAYEKRLKDEQHETITPEQTYFLQETLKDLKRSGLELPKEQQDAVRKLVKESAQLAMTFDANLAAARGSIEVSREDLKGLDESFINSLERTADGRYRVTTDYSQFHKVLEQCEVAQTRKDLYRAFIRRGYPENEKVLERIIAINDELSHLLGYKSYTHYMLDDLMAKSPERVNEFLTTVYERLYPKLMDETKLVKKDLHPSVEFKDGKFQPWDVSFVYYYYKKEHLDVDEAEVAQYFPLTYTLPALLKVYEDFFGICFKKMEKVYLWHEDVMAYAVYKKGQYLGTIILDIFPRPFKYTHAANIVIVPSVKEPSGKILPAVVTVLANFPPDKPDAPSLLKRSEVTTFFHEFGHALHGLLGSTELAGFSGTAVKGDFVEMPSQMLEEWLWDPAILKAVSSHVTTKEPLPDELIEKILASKHIDTGSSLLRQVFLAQVSLAYYLEGAKKPLQNMWQSFFEKYRPDVHFDPESRAYCSFTHITSYGPRYYGYLWSKVFALDLFSQIKPHGLRNPDIGARYTQEVLSKGGSQDPNELLKAFLGREPNTDAFFKDLGL